MDGTLQRPQRPQRPSSVQVLTPPTMRPLSGGDAPPSARPPSRKSSVAEHVPTTFFMRTEEAMQQSEQATRTTANVEPTRRPKETTYGVQSLADTLAAAFGSERPPADRGRSDCARAHTAQSRRDARRPSQDSSSSSSSSPSFPSLSSHSPAQSPPPPPNAAPHPSLPPSIMPSTPTSLSLQSLALSDPEYPPEEAPSQALASSRDDGGSVIMDTSASFPQLVMPSIQMPSRRPFTTKGKAMGKLKVLVAGRAGIGKTSLIRSMVHLCEDIVHVDSISTSATLSRSSPSRQRPRKKVAGPSSTLCITETHASTKPYPPWWTDVEESRVLRRRKGSTDAILERNICFVDTPGYSADAYREDDMGQVLDYLEDLLHQTSAVTNMHDGDCVGLISGTGGIAVDVILYLLPPLHDISYDVEYMQRLSVLTNVIPVIAKSDTLSPAELITAKTSILARLQTTSMQPFFFGNALDDALLAVQELTMEQALSPASDATSVLKPKEFPFPIPTHPFAVSSTLGLDTETMDASVLMSPDYTQPLLPSELAALVNHVFDPESIAWLRHSAAKKFIGWRRRIKLVEDSFTMQNLQKQQQQQQQQKTLRRGSVSTSASVGLNGAALNQSAASSILTTASPSGVLVPRAGSLFYDPNLQSPFPDSSPSLVHTHAESFEPPSGFSLACYTHTVQGEKHLAEMRLAKWATDLQRSLRNEKDRYEELQRNERARWLLERVGEEVASGNIVASPGGSPRADWAMVRHGRVKDVNVHVGRRHGGRRGLDSRDPLGLCDFSDEVREQGYVFVKLLGGASVLGAALITAMKVLGWDKGLPDGEFWTWFAGPTE